MNSLIKVSNEDLLVSKDSLCFISGESFNYLLDKEYPLIAEKGFKEDFITLYPQMSEQKKLIVINSKIAESKDKRKNIFKKILAENSDLTFLVDSFVSNPDDLILIDLFETIEEKVHLLTFKSKKNESHEYQYAYQLTPVDLINRALIISESIIKAKNLVNTPYNYLNAKELAIKSKELEKHEKITVEIYNKKEIEELNMNLFLGVNKGSYDEPQLIVLKYQGLEQFDNPTALIGKGVMYDTGGYSLKTPISMPGMKTDMAGAAAVISAIEGIARLNLKCNVLGVVAATDNRMGEYAIVPDDILTSAKGLTVEIISTDAEGRLTLADALWFAQKEGAKKLIDVATLTGAMVAALGSDYTGVFTNSHLFLDDLMKSSKEMNEPLWEMPVGACHHTELKSEVADLKNKGGRNAGASIAAAFLEEFVDKDNQWIHIDIAGTSSLGNGLATGVMVKSFIHLFE